jgi:hypothetical protein
MLTRIILGVFGVAWLGYGIFCFVSPGQLATIAGITTQEAWGVTELRAMYGGVQIAIGASALWGAIRPAWSRWALQVQLVVYLGLVPARTLSALMVGDSSSYTIGAIAFEAVSLVITLWLLRRSAA